MKNGLPENFQTLRGLFPIIIKTEAIEATHNYQLIFLHKAAGSITASFMPAVIRFINTAPKAESNIRQSYYRPEIYLP